MAKNIIEKIWQAHVVKQTKGHPAIFAIDRMLMHEVTSAQAFDTLQQRQLPVHNPKSIIATLDHSIPTSITRKEIADPMARQQVEALRDNAKKHGIELFDFDSQYQGIVHVIGPELGFTWPGSTLVCGDSHTSTHGAFGAMAFGVGTSEVAHVLATGCILQYEPKTMKVEFSGQFRPGVGAKDAIMKLIATIGIGGANGHIIEYTGSAVQAMSMEARMTLCNMSIECGAKAGLIAPDETTFSYLKNRRYAPSEMEWAEKIKYWKTLKSDPGCHYDHQVLIDLDVTDPRTPPTASHSPA